MRAFVFLEVSLWASFMLVLLKRETPEKQIGAPLPRGMCRERLFNWGNSPTSSERLLLFPRAFVVRLECRNVHRAERTLLLTKFRFWRRYGAFNPLRAPKSLPVSF